MKKILERKNILLLLLILVLAAFLRLYRIADYMTFLGDEGRDVLVVKHLLEGDWVGLGPTASVGGFFSGPVYYYFMAPFLWLFHLNPVGPAVMVALFGIATVFLVYLVGKIFFNKYVGLFAAALYTVSPLVLGYSRSSWNPNLMPFFSLVIILFLYFAVKKNSWKLFLLVGFLFGIAFQLHYIETFFGVTIALYIFFFAFRNIKKLVKQYALVVVGFLGGFSPFLAFEFTHGFQNIIAVKNFALGGTGETGFAGGKFTVIVGDVFFRLFGRLITRFPPPDQVALGAHPYIALWHTATLLLALFSVGFLLVLLYKSFKKKSDDVKKYALLALWLGIGVLFFGFYKKPIYDYYFEFMFPLPFLLVGNVFARFCTTRIITVASIVIFIALFLWNLDGMPFKYPPNRQLAQVRLISEYVLEKAEGKPFNFALITGGNSDHAYRYFFELEGNPPVVIKNVEIDPKRESITNQLLIVCEDPGCQPLGNSLWEVAGYGKASIAGGPWDVSVVKIYKLIHYTGID